MTQKVTMRSGEHCVDDTALQVGERSLELKCFDAADKWSGGVVRHVALGAVH